MGREGGYVHHIKLEMQNLERPRLVCSYGLKTVHLSLVTNLLPSIILDDPCSVLLKARDFAFFKDEGIFRIFKFTFCDEESAARFKTKYDAVYSLMPLPEPITRANCTALAALEYLEKEVLELAKEEEIITEQQSDWFANTAGGMRMMLLLREMRRVLVRSWLTVRRRMMHRRQAAKGVMSYP